MALMLIAFFAGVLTVLAPCVLPLLPVILGGGARSGATRRSAPYVIVAALAVSIVVFTLLLKASTALIDIPEVVWKVLAGGILVVMGVVTLFPTLWTALRASVPHRAGRANALLARGRRQQSFWGDVLVGAALGPVFSSCSPTFTLIVGIVLPQSFAQGLVLLLVYVLGLAVVLLPVAFAGRRLAARFGALADPHGWFKRALGVLFIVVGVAVLGGWDKAVETAILRSGAYGGITRWESGIVDALRR